MESEPSPTEASSDEISNEKLIDGDTITHVKETENIAAEANLDVECRNTNAEGHSNDRSDSVVVPVKTVQEEDESHQEPDISISSEERATVHSGSETQEECSSATKFASESADNKEHMQVEETDSGAKKDQMVPELVHESKRIHGEAIDSSTIPRSTSETEGSMEEPLSGYASAEPAPQKTGDVSEDEQIMVKSSNVEVDVKEVDVDTGLIHPPTEVDPVETIEKNKESETKITDVEVIESLEADKVVDQSLEIENENSLETINPVKAVPSAIEIEENRDLEAMITDDKQKITLEVEGVVNLAIEAATRMAEIPAFVIPTQSSSGSTLEIGPAEETEEKEIKDDKNDAVMEVEKQFPSESTNAAREYGIDLENKKLETKPEDGSDETPKEVDKDVPNESSHATSAIVSAEETSEVEAKVAKQFPDDSINDTSSIGVDKEIKQTEVELVVDTQEAASEHERELQTDCSSATLAVELEETRAVEVKVEKKFLDKSISEIPSIGIDEETEELEVEFAEDAQAVATKIKRELQTDSIVATSAIIKVKEATGSRAKIEDEEQEALAGDGKQFPNDSSSATSTAEVEETREVEDKVEKQFPHESVNDTSSIVEVALAEDAQVEATEIKRELQIDSTVATSAIIKAKKATDIGAKIEDEEQEALDKVGKQFPNDSSSATSAVEVQETREVEGKVEKQFSHESVNDTSSIGVDEETKELEVELAEDAQVELAEDAQEEATEIKRELPTDSIVATSAIIKAKEVTDTGDKIEDEEQETLAEVGKQFPNDSSSASSAIEVQETREVEDKVEKHFSHESVNDISSIGVNEEVKELEVELAKDAQEEETEIKRELYTDFIVDTSAIMNAKEAIEIGVRVEDMEQEGVTNVGKRFPKDSSNASLAIEVEENREVDAKVEKQFPHEFINDTSSIGVDEETKELEVALAEDAQVEATEIKRELQTDSIVAISAIIKAKEATDTEFINDTSSIGADEETKELEVALAEDAQVKATEIKRELQTDSIVAISAIIRAKEATDTGVKIEHEEHEALAEVGKQFPNDSSSATSAVEVEKTREVEDKVEKQFSHESVNDTSSIGVDGKIKELEVELAEDEQEEATEIKRELQIDSIVATSANIKAKEAIDTGAKIEDEEQEALAEVGKQFPDDSSSATSAVEVQETREVEDKVEKQCSHESINDTSSIGVHEETKELEVELAEDAQEEETKFKRELQTDSIVATSAIMKAKEATDTRPKIEDVEQGALAEVGKQLPNDSGSATSSVEVEETKAVEDKVEKQFSHESVNDTSSIGVDEKTKDLEVELGDDTQEEATEVKRELQTNSRDASAIITAEEAAELGAKIEHEEQEALTRVGQKFPSDSSCATLVVKVEETREPDVKFAHSKQEMEVEVDREAPSEFTCATLTTLTAEGTKETEATAADDKQEVATEVEKECPIDSCSATPAIGIDEEARELEVKLADGIQEAVIEVEKLFSTESDDVLSTIVTADKAKDVKDKIEDDKQEAYIKVEKQILSEYSTAASAIGTVEETRKQEGELEYNNQETARELGKQVPTKPCTANPTIVPAEKDTEIGLVSGTEVEASILSESSTATPAIGTDEETRELEVKLADDEKEVATTVEKQISTDSSGAAPATVGPEETKELEGKKKDDKQEVANEVEEPVLSNSSTSTLATGAADEIRGPEAKLADENQGANEVEMQVSTEFSCATSAILIAEEISEIEADKQGSETEGEEQVPNDSLTSLPAARTYKETREPEVPIADDNQEEVAEVAKIVPTLLSGIDLIPEETRELEAIIEDDKQVETELETQVPSESSSDNSTVVKTEEIRETETKLDDKQDTAIEGKKQTHGDSSTATLVAPDEQEAAAEVENEVSTDSCGSNSAIATSKELRETEVSIIDGYQEAAKDVEKQVPSDSITASSATGTNEETSEFDDKLADDAKEVEAVLKHVPTESISDSSSIVSAEENTETEAQTEDDKKAAGKKLEQVPETDEATKRLEVKLEDYKQPTDCEEVPTESSALAVETATETKELEAKTEVDRREEVEKQVQSESTSAISAIGTIEEARELEGKVANGKEEDKTVTEKQVLIQENEADATSEIAQVFIDKEKDILLVEIVDDKDNSLDNLEIHTDIGNLAKEDAIDINVPEPPTDPKIHETSNGSSVILFGDETKVEALNEKQDTPVEIKEPSADEPNKIVSNSGNFAIGAAEETTEIESEVAKRKQEATVDIENQVPSDSIIASSVMETAVETRKLEAEILEDKQREATVVDKQVASQAIEIDASSDIIEVSIKEENDIVIVEMVDGGHMETTKLAKEDASYIGMPEVFTNVRANQSPFATSVVPTSHDEFTQPKLEVIDEMQEKVLEIEEPSVTETNRSDSASVSAEVPLEEETSHVGIENIEDKKEDILDPKTSIETSDGINVDAKISEIAFEGVKGPKDDEMVRKNNECSQITETDKDNESSKVDTIIIAESFKNLDNGTQIDDASFEGNRSSEGVELVKNELKEGNIASPGITEVSNELGKSPDVVEEIEETNGGKIQSGSPSLNMTSRAEVRKDPKKSPIGIEVSDNESKNFKSKTMPLYETTKLDDENAEISNILSEENKAFEGPEVVQDDTKEEIDYKASITRESKDDNIASKESYIETPKDLDVKEVIATVTSGVTELLDVEYNKGSGKEEIEKPKDQKLVLDPKSVDVNKIEVSPKQEISAKSSPRRSNNIISKVKHSIVKAKKAIMGKSPTPKDASPRSKEIK